LTLPFFNFIRGKSGPALISKFNTLLQQMGALFLLALPLEAVEWFLNPDTIGRKEFVGFAFI
jgi:hypothetical protein